MKLVEAPDNSIPPGAVPGSVETIDGLVLRTAYFLPPDTCRGTVLIASGRAEYIEKYFERIDREQ